VSWFDNTGFLQECLYKCIYQAYAVNPTITGLDATACYRWMRSHQAVFVINTKTTMFSSEEVACPACLPGGQLGPGSQTNRSYQTPV